MYASSHTNAFHAALAAGHAVEAAVRAHLATVGWGVGLPNHTGAYDFAVTTPTRTHLVEVKDEQNYAASGNIILELYQGEPRRPSGLAATEAGIVIHSLGPEAVLYRTNAMKGYLKRTKAKVVKFGGADNHNAGVIFRIADASEQEWLDQVRAEHLHESRVWS